MNVSRISISIIFSITLVLSGCTPAPPDIPINIPSFRAYYPILLEEAQKWHIDAYLHEARIFLFPRSSDSYLISTSFYTPSEDSESLAVYVLQDNTVTSETFIHEYPIYQHKPITENDWKIDSHKALEYMLDEAGQLSLDRDKNACSFIILERVLHAHNQPVVWFLSLWDCSDAVYRSYLDANSGEILDSSMINIKPTRFPTPTP